MKWANNDKKKIDQINKKNRKKSGVTTHRPAGRLFPLGLNLVQLKKKTYSQVLGTLSHVKLLNYSRLSLKCNEYELFRLTFKKSLHAR